MIQAKKKRSLMRRRVIASVISLAAVLVLLIAMVIVQNMVKVTPWDDVDGTRYYIRPENDVYGLYDANEVILPIESNYEYYVTLAGTLVDIDPETGAVKEVILVDNAFSSEGNENFDSDTHRTQIFPHLESKNILSIEVHNEHGTYTFHRFDTVSGKVDKNANFVIKNAETTTYDPEALSGLYVDAGYALSALKLKNPIKDANGEFSEYGLVPEKRQRPVLDENGVPKKENDVVLTEEYDYEPAYYILTDIKGNRHKMIIGDALLTEGGYYVQYVDLSGSEEVKRDAVYVLNPSIEETLLAPIEDLVQPMISYPLGMMTYTNVQNFVVRQLQRDKDGSTIYKENGSPIYKPVVSFSFKDISERDNTIWAAYPFHFVDLETQDQDADTLNKIYSMKGYTPHTSNITQTLQNLYEPEFVDVIRLNPTKEELYQYGLYEIRKDQFGKPLLDENGNIQYSEAPHYTLAFDYTVEDSENPNIRYTHSHDILISKKQNSDNYYVYTIVTTTSFEKQSNGEWSEIRGIPYSYNTVVEVAGHSLDFVEWDTMNWISKSIVQDHIAFIDRIEIDGPNGYHADFDLDNSMSDDSTTSSEFLKVIATDSNGNHLETLNYVEIKNSFGSYYIVTSNSIHCVDTKGNAIDLKTLGSFHYAYNDLGYQVLVSSDNGRLPGTSAYVFANEVIDQNGNSQTRYSTDLFRLLYQSFFYTEIMNSYNVSEEEEAALTDESNLLLRLTVHTEDRDGTKNSNVYAFYRISSRKAYITINGNGGFYVQADRIEKILSDVQKFFNCEVIDPLAKK